MSAFCERCGRELPLADLVSCNICHPPRLTMRERLDAIDERLHEFFNWLDYRATVLEFLAIYAGLIIGGLFAAASLITVLFVSIRAWVMLIMGVIG